MSTYFSSSPFISLVHHKLLVYLIECPAQVVLFFDNLQQYFTVLLEDFAMPLKYISVLLNNIFDFYDFGICVHVSFL